MPAAVPMEGGIPNKIVQSPHKRRIVQDFRERGVHPGCRVAINNGFLLQDAPRTESQNPIGQVPYHLINVYTRIINYV